MTNLNFLDSNVSLPFQFNAMLPYSEDDKEHMPWMAQKLRYYGIEQELKKGGRAIAFQGFFSDEDGQSKENLPKIVLKLPNINTNDYTLDQIKDYLARQSEEGGREWQLTHKRLKECKYANPIFDFNVYQVSYLGELLPFPVTAQLYLNDASSLDDYLLNTRQRTEPYLSKRGIPFDNWKGMSSPSKWIELAKSIATGLADIHQRRVVHGDIWPPNIFIKIDHEGKPQPIFIDFGEAYPLEPRGIPRKQRDHAYRAPERKDSQSIVTQLADVYSFGKLLLHLAIGEEPILSPSYKGHKRREKIREKFATRNPGIVSDNPFIIDIICKCVSLDPVDRPNMNEVLRAFNSYVDLQSFSSRRPKVSERLESIDTTWRTIKSDLAARDMSVGPFLEELVEQRMYDIEAMINGLANDVITVNDTRERLILDLLILFRRLEKGDRYISVTNPRMWQGSALGLDGRYFSATQLATLRGASIQRVFIFSIQEVGDKWAMKWAEKLEELYKSEKYVNAKELARFLRVEINKYMASIKQGEVREISEDLQIEARQRLTLVIKSYFDASTGICKGLFDKSETFDSCINCKGLYLGFIPVSTLSVMRIHKAANPVSVFFYNSAEKRDQHLLMMTDCLGRHSYVGSEESPFDDEAFQKAKPELRGITVFKSVLGVPEDRIKKLEQIFRHSINVGGWIEKFYQTVPSDKNIDVKGM